MKSIVSTKAVAVTFALLMLLPALPVAEATHTDGITPDLPILPRAHPEDECLPVGVQDRILAEVNELRQGDTAVFRDDEGVASLCVSGSPVSQYQQLVRDADRVLAIVRNVSAEVQRQVDTRVEATLPEGALPNELVRPRTVLLSDGFDGSRIGGFGDWQVVTEGGVEPEWTRGTARDANASFHTYRFGDDAGYARGAHQWLVSPEIDMTALFANKTANVALTQLRDDARNQLYSLCNEMLRQGSGPAPLAQYCGTKAAPDFGEVGGPRVSPHELIVRAYEKAIDDAVYSQPVMQHTATLDITYRLNMAPFQDGVRVWLYSGERAPDRTLLFREDRGNATDQCVTDTGTSSIDDDDLGVSPQRLLADNEARDKQCSTFYQGGTILRLAGSPGFGEIKAFADEDDGNKSGLTGRVGNFTTLRVNLTPWSQQRVWLLFEVRTLPNDRGVDIFSGEGTFQHPRDFGFELARVHAEGAAYHRNFRLKDVAENFPPSLSRNRFSDATSVHTTVPPGNEMPVVRLHNAGDYTENGTVTVTFFQKAPGDRDFTAWGTSRHSVSLRPDEVRKFAVMWPSNLTEGHLYRIDARLDVPADVDLPPVPEQTQVTNGTSSVGGEEVPNPRFPSATDPNATRVRPANAANISALEAGSLTASRLVRSATERNLTAVRADGLSGRPIQVCKSVIDGVECEALDAARKGEPRIVLAGIRNDGNAAQDAYVLIDVYKDGAPKADVVTDGLRRDLTDLLPGETRAVRWTLTPTEAGIYRVVLALYRDDGTQEPTLNERLLYVGRSTGLVCLDDLAEDRECGPAFRGGLDAGLAGENVTAATLVDGKLVVATEVLDGQGRLLRRDGDAWTRIADLVGANLTSRFEAPLPSVGYGSIRQIVPAPDGALYLVGDNNTALKVAANGALTRIPLNDTPDRTNLTSAVWYKGTLVAVGQNGTLARLVGDKLERSFLTNTSVNRTDGDKLEPFTYDGTLRAILVAPDGRALLAGDRGFLARHNLTNDVTGAQWREVTRDGVPLGWKLDNATLRTLLAHEGRVFVGGDNALMVNVTASTWRSVTLPPSPTGAFSPTAAFRTHMGAGAFVTPDGIVTCAACSSADDPRWSFPAIVVPTVIREDDVHPARLALGVSDATATYLLGEAGALLRLERRGIYDNEDDWTTVTLAPRDGGVIQTTWSPAGGAREPQSYIGVPDAGGKDVSETATSYRVILNHHVRRATPTARAEVRLIWQDVDNFYVGTVNETCPREGSNPGTTSGTLSTVCNQPFVRDTVLAFERPTRVSEWERNESGEVRPPSVSGIDVPDGAKSLYAVELHAEMGVEWAVDDIVVQGKTPSGAWRDIIVWKGMGTGGSSGTWYIVDTESSVFGPNETLPSSTLRTSRASPSWEEWHVPFDYDFPSPWHVSQKLTDRPVWAANSEVYASFPEPKEPRLLPNWNSRLVSPVIDLTDAFDPVVEFNHLYAFRSKIVLGSVNDVTPGDGGVLEVQYLLRGEECGARTDDVTCGWSRFYPVRPDNGYPTKEKLGLAALDYAPSTESAEPGRVGFDVLGREALSYWGRHPNAAIDEVGVISAPRLTANYVPERVTLANVTCKAPELLQIQQGRRVDCVPIDELAGRQIRFAFHLITAGSNTRAADEPSGHDQDGTWNHTQPSSVAPTYLPRSYPGEGWYVADFKVRGARTLGVDLRATNMTLRVGYDVDAIGVGPGTRVPVNVTVENKGRFEVPGYTGTLEVREVVNAAAGVTNVSARIPLRQQPVLDPGKSTNHTLYWDVPPKENANYTLTFVVEPIGIDRDEDHTDNTQRLGSLADPIPARTFRRIEVVQVVSPENATIDITRYVPIFINNTGNVPVDDILVERRIRALGRSVGDEVATCSEWASRVVGAEYFTSQPGNASRLALRSAILNLTGFELPRELQIQIRAFTAFTDCRDWRTTQPAPAGALTPLTSLSDEVDSSIDLFWKAPEPTNFQFRVGAVATLPGGATLTGGALPKSVSAFATFLYDDVEEGLRGEAISGAWAYGPGWNATQPGFRSTDSYGFGDPLLGRYPADTDGALTTPWIDISNARTTRFAFYHRYDLEEGFDGGVVQARVRGGEWTTLTPLPDTLNKLPAGYNQSVALSPASAIHPTGDPADVAFAYTGDSRELPANVDGWVLTQFDLTSFEDVIERGASYESYGAAEIGGYGAMPDVVTKAPNAYYSKSWLVGPEDEFRYWQVDNLTQATRGSPAPKVPGEENTLWWSGSASREDDGKRPLQNNVLFVDIDVSRVRPDQTVIADWWEYAERFNQASYDSITGKTNAPQASQLLAWHTFHDAQQYSNNYRYNLTAPKIIETKGNWFHMQSDLTGILPLIPGGKTLTVGFAYTPWVTNASELATYNDDKLAEAMNSTATEMHDWYEDDDGIVIDAFTVQALTTSRGQVLDAVVLADEKTAWNGERNDGAEVRIEVCNPRITSEASSTGRTACFKAGDSVEKTITSEVWNFGTPIGPRTTGFAWNVITESELPDQRAGWNVVKVLDQDGKDEDTPRPTGAVPHAWWTGEIPCKPKVGAEGCEDRAWEPCQSALDDTRPYGACPRPGSESRLVTPAIDLGRIAGEDAQLTFWHRYAFDQYHFTGNEFGGPSGGVVEVQEYDPQSGTWSEWKQIYSKPHALDPALELLDPLTPTNAAIGDFRGGYTQVTAPRVRSVDGFRYYNAPFDTVQVPGRASPVQYLYSGNSRSLEENATGDLDADGWMQETFDLREYYGKRVRFGFHVWFSPWKVTAQDERLVDIDRAGNDKGGWWVGDVAIQGKVLTGREVQLRLRAGSDANVQDGHWQVDDLGVFGARYKDNLGLFVDATPDKFGALVPNGTAVVPVLLRNLGDSVRRDLAIEVRQTEREAELNITVPDAPGGVVREGGVTRVQGYTLGPGQSVQVNLTVRVPRSVGLLTGTQLVLTLKESNPTSSTTPYVPVVDNEVQGFLTRIVDFRFQQKPAVVFSDVRVEPAQPAVGQPVRLVVTAFNPGFTSATLATRCEAATVTEWHDRDHRNNRSADEPESRSEFACVRKSGDLTLPAKGWTNLTFEATPQVAGHLGFRIVPSIGGDNLTVIQGGAMVGRSPILFYEPFAKADDVDANWSNRAASHSTGGAEKWAYARGYRATGALLLGIDENATRNGDQNYAAACEPGATGGGVCTALSPVVDLHNHSKDSSLFLSFWHMDRFARHDGGWVRAQVLLNEQQPGFTSSWSQPCTLRAVAPEGGVIRQYAPVEGDLPLPGDPNPVFDGRLYPTTVSPPALMTTDPLFFVSDGGSFEDQWSLAAFDLSGPCTRTALEVAEGDAPTESLMGRKVRFIFQAFLSTPTGNLSRGNGHGWLIDDVSVGPSALRIAPVAAQTARLLDNTTKGFHVVLTNLGDQPDLVRVRYDEGNSSAPAGSIVPPTDAVLLQPGETRIVRVDVKLPRDPSLLPTGFRARLVAASELDPNAVGATTLDLVFAPRQWAELSVAVAAPTGLVQEGTEVFVPITVENNGLVESVATRVRITDVWPGGSRVEHLDLPPMASYFAAPDEANRVLEYRWRPEKGSLGQHVLTIEVDPDVLGEEYTRVNNVAVVVAQVSELLIPDLDVTNASALTLRNAVGGVVSAARDADVARYEVTAGELVSFELKVHNQGRAGATNVDVRAFLGSLSLPPKTIPYVAPGAEAVVTFNWLAQKGEHEIEFLVRGEQVELTTDNNRNPGTGVTILTVKGYEVSVDILDVGRVLEPGELDVRVPFRITNSGNAGEDLVLRASAPAGLTLQLPREGFFLRAGETYEGTARLSLSADAVAGEQVISIEAVARENPMKVASGRAATRVNASYGGSVDGAVALGAPPEMVIPIDLVNEGNSLEPWTVIVRLPAGWVSKEPQPLKVSVPAHGQKRVEMRVAIPETTAPGVRIVAVKATMPNGEVREGTVRVDVLPFRQAALKVEDVLPRAERGALKMPVVVENTGNVQQPFSVLVTTPPEGVQLTLSPSTFDLPPGGRAIAELTVKPDASVDAGTYTVSAYTRFEGVIPATAEGRANLQTLKVDVLRQDVRLSSIEYAPRADLDAGDRVTVKATVENHGLGDLVDVPVHLFVDDVFIAESVVPRLPGSGRADVTFNWTAITGAHTLTVVVDPYEDTVDGDRADNAVSALAAVGIDANGGQVAAGRADTPGVGVAGILAAILVALLAIPSMGSRRQRR